MDFLEFYNELSNKLGKINVDINDIQANNFYNYMLLLKDWNEKINLTAIKEPKEIILKHFVDSATISKYIKEKQLIVDIGTGAGFPGIPLNIMNNKANYILVDSLNKRINFLNEVINKLELTNINTIHIRAEEFGKCKNNRDRFDVATSRAVASLNVLLEYMIPLVKIGGRCICMKGPNIDDELQQSEKALKILGGRVEKIEKIILPDSDIVRNIIIIKKEFETPSKYPRKPGIVAKEPI